MNGYKEIKVKVTVEIEGEAPAVIERTVRYYDTESRDKELAYLGSDGGRFIEHTAYRAVVAKDL